MPYVDRATDSDLPFLTAVRAEAVAWLRERGIDQWHRPLPAERLRAVVRAGCLYVVRDDDGAPAAMFALEPEPIGGLWTAAELGEPSLYMRWLIVRRACAGRGLGRRALDWASDRAAASGCRWVRGNVNTGNRRLQDFYLRHGFAYVRTVAGGGEAGDAGWLVQRAARPGDGHGLRGPGLSTRPAQAPLGDGVVHASRDQLPASPRNPANG